MRNENAYTREAFNFVVEWCKPLGIIAIATDFTKDVRDDTAILVLTKCGDNNSAQECVAKMERERDKSFWLIISQNEEEYKSDKELFEVEDITDYEDINFDNLSRRVPRSQNNNVNALDFLNNI